MTEDQSAPRRLTAAERAAKAGTSTGSVPRVAGAKKAAKKTAESSTAAPVKKAAPAKKAAPVKKAAAAKKVAPAKTAAAAKKTAPTVRTAAQSEPSVGAGAIPLMDAAFDRPAPYEALLPGGVGGTRQKAVVAGGLTLAALVALRRRRRRRRTIN